MELKFGAIRDPFCQTTSLVSGVYFGHFLLRPGRLWGQEGLGLEAAFSMDLWSWFRSCAKCSQYLPPIDLLCDPCWKVLEQRKSPRRRSVFEGSFEVFSYWNWRSHDDLVGEMIRHRKGDGFDLAHSRLARRILREEAAPFGSVKSLVFPSKNLRGRDHTASLAGAFAELLRVPAVAIPISNNENYKNQGQQTRLAQRRALGGQTEKVTFPTMFIDDVYTTGATALAVWKALQRPRQFSATVLAYKLSRQEANRGH